MALLSQLMKYATKVTVSSCSTDHPIPHRTRSAVKHSENRKVTTSYGPYLRIAERDFSPPLSGRRVLSTSLPQAGPFHHRLPPSVTYAARVTARDLLQSCRASAGRLLVFDGRCLLPQGLVSPFINTRLAATSLGATLVQQNPITHSNFVLGNAQAPGWPIVYCSDGFCELTGFSRAHVMAKGSGCKFLYGPETEEEETSKIMAAIREKRELKTELKLYRKNELDLRTDKGLRESGGRGGGECFPTSQCVGLAGLLDHPYQMASSTTLSSGDLM
ncbi:hypothetical protein RRG08_044270 [Elysia crispata]|uniref:PAS domain-containing protein n=1 Tax=Elysia crispata TaxID=231223 RepID=A0AAE0XXB3_9GAST|nr:hypothetical protein RRG08_044270 [Elysia crispata]